MNQQPLQWYPGHMKKADREISEKRKLINLVIEVLDARAPISSRNPEIQKFCLNKKHIVILNKADLADPEKTERWINYLKKEPGVDEVISFNASEKGERKKLIKAINRLNQNNKKRLKCLVVGIPNSGKSTIINNLVGKRKTKVADKPGVTRGQQWLNTDEGFLLLDTPGILWPKFEDEKVGLHLAFIGAISDRLFEKENIAADLVKFLVENYPELLEKTYNINVSDLPIWMIFDQIAQNRNFLIKGGEYDYLRTSEKILKDFKEGNLGRISIETIES